MYWHIHPLETARLQQLTSSLNIHPVTAQILLNRGIATPEAAAAFLTPRVHHLHDPYLLPDMERAVTRIGAALCHNERILLFGDYDTDGVTGTALALLFFRALGTTAQAFCPHRIRDGYGLTVTALERLWQAGQRPQLIITIDNGTTASEALVWAAAHGIDVVVTDHHEVPPVLPAAHAVVNPKRRDVATPYPFPGLCGVGVVFKLCTALRHHLRSQGFFATRVEPNIAQWLDLVMIGTIADIVPLIDENRIFCAFGLKALGKTTNLGLQALCQVAGVDPARCTARTVGFQLAPRLNAAGRLHEANCAVELLTTDRPERARELAGQLHRLNAERQAMEERIRASAEAQLVDAPVECCSIVAASAEWSPGVVGIVASRIAGAQRKPTILISTQEAVGIGSARGVGEFPLLEALTTCATHLLRFGGHAKAAGVTIDPGKIADFRAAFETAVRERLRPEHRQHTVLIDAELGPNDISPQLVDEIARLGPFGEGNREPVLCLRNMGITQRRIVGGKHLKLTVHGGTITFDAIGFSMHDHPDHAATQVDLAFTPEHNEWNGVRSIQLKLRDLRKMMSN